MKRLLLLFALAPACLPEITKDEVVPTDDSSDSEPLTQEDADNDGYPAAQDCDDQDPNSHPDATELCDGVDNNCINGIDEGVTTPWFTDADSDGYGEDATAVQACSAPTNGVAIGGDCDDGDATAHPGAAEACDGVDTDCDGELDPPMNVLHFETNSSVTIPDGPTLSFGTEGTLEAWIWWEGEGSYLFNKSTFLSEDKQVWLDDAYLNVLLVGDATSREDAVSSEPHPVSTDRWVHVAASWSEGTVSLFIDGARVSAGNMPGEDPLDGLGSLFIGQATRVDANGPLPGINGFISDVRISPTARYSSSFTPEANLQADGDTTALYKMDEGSGPAVFDTVGAGSPGAIYGATWTTTECRR